MSESTSVSEPLATSIESTVPGLGNAVRSEIVKLFSVRSQRWLIFSTAPIAAVVAVVCGTTLPQSTGRSLSTYAPLEQLSAFMYGNYATAIVACVLGALYVGVEYSTKQAVSTFAVTPRRGRVLVAKTAVMVVTGLVIGIVASAICTGIAMAVTPGGLDMGADGMVRSAVLFALQPAFYGALAVLSAFIFRSSTYSLLVSTALFAVLPGVARAVPHAVDVILKPLLPVAGLHGIAGTTQPGSTEDVGAIGGAVILVVWLGVAFVIALRTLDSRDA